MKRSIFLIVIFIIGIVLLAVFFRTTGDDRAMNGDVVNPALENTSIEEATFRTESQDNENMTEGEQEDGTSVEAEAPDSVTTITYSSDGFSPEVVTIASGATVRWVNESGGAMWVASDMHPTHSVYGGTTRSEHCPNEDGAAFDQCEGGGEYVFEFAQIGEWDYHDHLNPRHTGRVIVE